MSKQLQQVITSVEQLSTTEQIELIKIVVDKLLTKPVIKLKLFDTIFQLLRQTFDPANQPGLEPAIEGTPSSRAKKVDEVTADFWPADESVDEFLAFIYQQRRRI